MEGRYVIDVGRYVIVGRCVGILVGTADPGGNISSDNDDDSLQ